MPIDQPGMLDELGRVAPAMLEEWSRTKKPPRHAAWLHEGEFEGPSKEAS